MLPQRLPKGAVPDSGEHEFERFTADPNSPAVQALAASIGWDRVRQIQADEEEAIRQQQEETRRGPQ